MNQSICPHQGRKEHDEPITTECGVSTEATYFCCGVNCVHVPRRAS